MTSHPYNYDRPFWSIIGPDAELVDAPCSNDYEHVREVYREFGVGFDRFGMFCFRHPNCRVIEFNPIEDTLRDVTDEWFEELFAEELAEERRPITREEHEGNLADKAWKERA